LCRPECVPSASDTGGAERLGVWTTRAACFTAAAPPNVFAGVAAALGAGARTAICGASVYVGAGVIVGVGSGVGTRFGDGVRTTTVTTRVITVSSAGALRRLGQRPATISWMKSEAANAIANRRTKRRSRTAGKFIA
jgi:hypothetical protein